MVVAEHGSDFKEGFKAWLESNYHVYEKFERHALHIARFRKHYSARTIIEHMRFEEDTQDNDPKFKLNNNSVPDMSRLFILANPKYRDLFEVRVSPQRSHIRNADSASSMKSEFTSSPSKTKGSQEHQNKFERDRHGTI